MLAVTSDLAQALDLASADIERFNAKEVRLVADLEAVRAERQKLIHFCEMASKYSGVEIAGASGTQVGEATRSRVCYGALPRPGSKTANLVEAVLDAIDKAGHPLAIKDLVSAVHARDLTIGGANEAANLAGYLSRDKRIQYARGIGWSRATAAAQKDETVSLVPRGNPLTASGANQDLQSWSPTPQQLREAEAGGGTS